MSFILDALKTLEKKRHHSSVPNILTVHGLPPQETKKRLLWPYLILSALLLNAIILTVWLRPWETDMTKTVTQTIPAKMNETGSIVSASENSPIMDKDIVNESAPMNVIPESQPVQTDEQAEPQVETTSLSETSSSDVEIIGYAPDEADPVYDNKESKYS